MIRIQKKKKIYGWVVIPVLIILPLVIAILLPEECHVNIFNRKFDELNFLAVVIALATYISAVRLGLLTRLWTRDDSVIRLKSDKPKCVILSLIPIDFNLILCGVGIATIYFFPGLLDENYTKSGISIIFIITIIYLIAEHVIAWIDSYIKFFSKK